MDVPNIKVNELANIYDCKNALVSTFLKRKKHDVELSNRRITGIYPEAVEAFFEQKGFDELKNDLVVAIGTNVGGAGKTSSTLNLATSARRMTGRDKAVVIIDTDSQGSLTTQILGTRIPSDEFVLSDYLGPNSCSLDEILEPISEPENNFWLIGSNLSNLYLDRKFEPRDIKHKMLSVIKDIFKKFGEGTKIFIDTPPQLSAVSQSIMCALAQLKCRTAFLIPIRADAFSMEGAKICVSEMNALKESYKGVDNINAKCFLSSYDSRLQVSIAIMRDLLQDDILSKLLCTTVIRHSTEVSRSAYKQETIFSASGKSAKNLTSDYTNLLLEILEFNLQN